MKFPSKTVWTFQTPSMEELNGEPVSTQSSIKPDVVHAGHSELLRLSQTDSVLSTRLTTYCHLRIWLAVTLETWPAKVVG
jgi:hypothetical protein